MSAMIGPDGKPSTFDGNAYVSEDRRYWWNGAAWQPFKKQGRFRPPIAVPIIVVAVVAGAWFALTHIPNTPAPAPTYGVTNTTIDSPQRFEFDYRRATTCNNLTFVYLFFDSAGKQVDRFVDEKSNQVIGGKAYHYSIYNFGLGINSHAVRFEAIPTCHG